MSYQLVGYPIGKSKYVVIKKDKIEREALACGAKEARALLKPRRNKGEVLYVRVGNL